MFTSLESTLDKPESSRTLNKYECITSGWDIFGSKWCGICKIRVLNWEVKSNAKCKMHATWPTNKVLVVLLPKLSRKYGVWIIYMPVSTSVKHRRPNFVYDFDIIIFPQTCFASLTLNTVFSYFVACCLLSDTVICKNYAYEYFWAQVFKLLMSECPLSWLKLYIVDVNILRDEIIITCRPSAFMFFFIKNCMFASSSLQTKV